jgi:cell division protein FtsB
VTVGAWIGLVAAVAAVLALLLVKPTRTLLDQRDRYADTTQRLTTLQAENERLHTKISALQDPAEISRTAREQNQRVPAGVKAVIVQPAPAPAALPAQWPFTLVNGVVTARLTDGTAAASTTTTVATTAAPTTGSTGSTATTAG